jgi:hypothetical protein
MEPREHLQHPIDCALGSAERSRDLARLAGERCVALGRWTTDVRVAAIEHRADPGQIAFA